MNDIIIKEQNLTKQKRIIRLHNNLINAVFSLSTDAKKLLLAIWLHADPEKSNIVKVYRKDIQDAVGLDIMNLNKQHREEIMNELIRKVITIRDITNPNNFLKFTLIRDTEYTNGLLEVDLSPNILPYIKEAQEKLFTRFNILSIKPLRSSYAIRTYLFCKQFEDTGFFKISIEDFKKKLEIQNKYKQPSDLKKRVLEVAKKQLNENTDLIVDYELEKQGRRYTNIVFTIKSKNPKNAKSVELSQNKPEPKQVKEKEEIKIAPPTLTGFKKFRQEIIAKAKEEGKEYIIYNDVVLRVNEDGLLIKDGRILNNTEAYDWWKTLYKNKDKIKLLSEEELKALNEKETDEFEELKKEVKSLKEKYKYLLISYRGENTEATLSDIQIEIKDDESIFKVFLIIGNTTETIIFNDLDKLKEFLQICNEAWREEEGII